MAATALGLELAHAVGLELEAYRPEHVAEQVRRAIEREGVADEVELAQLLRSDPGARRRFRRSIAVSVSGLFRDREQFDLLEEDLLPRLLAGNRRLTVWSAGCGDGSELYSVAILLDELGATRRSSLLGSDVLEENIARARRGVYGMVTIPSRLRGRVRFEVRDLVCEGAPPGRWSLVLCRSVVIYLAPAGRRMLHETLADALSPGGVLLLGRCERLADPAGLGLEQAAAHAYGKVG